LGRANGITEIVGSRRFATALRAGSDRKQNDGWQINEAAGPVLFFIILFSMTLSPLFCLSLFCLSLFCFRSSDHVPKAALRDRLSCGLQYRIGSNAEEFWSVLCVRVSVGAGAFGGVTHLSRLLRRDAFSAAACASCELRLSRSATGISFLLPRVSRQEDQMSGRYLHCLAKREAIPQTLGETGIRTPTTFDQEAIERVRVSPCPTISLHDPPLGNTWVGRGETSR